MTLAKQLIDQGRLGRIFHYRAKFLQDWTISKDLPQGGAGLWRLDVKRPGAELREICWRIASIPHMWLNGSMDKVTAMTETFVKERKHNLSGKVEKVGIDDACAFLARFKNGALATFESTRYGGGHKVLYTFEINGSRLRFFGICTIYYRLQYFDHRDEGRVRGWRSVHVTMGINRTWINGGCRDYKSDTNIPLFIRWPISSGPGKGKPASPTFRDALETQRRLRCGIEICEDRALGKSADGKRKKALVN